MGTVLVTGAAGFIGSALARRLIEDGHEVVTIDNLTTGYPDNIPDGCTAMIGDAHDALTIGRLSDYRFDAIYHVAGQSGGIPSFKDPAYDLKANVLSTLLLLEYAHTSGCPTFVYASSMAVYGDPSELPVTEKSALNPRTFYAVGKIASESYLRLYSERGLACVALRLNNTYGPGQDLSNLNQGMVSIFLAQAIDTGTITVKGSTDRMRDFVFIDDAVEAFLAAGVGALPGRFSVYNVATGIGTTVEELLAAIEVSLPVPVDVVVAGSTPGDQQRIYCSYDLIFQQLGWKPRVPMVQGVRAMAEWARGNWASGENGRTASEN